MSERTVDHERRTRLLAQALARVELPSDEPSACPYLEGRLARHEAVLPAPLVPGIYHSLMDLNFRRSGGVFYRTCCDACRECRAIRIPVDEFVPSRSQRRCRRRNADLDVEVGPPRPDDEKLYLYREYLAARHDGQMTGSTEEFHSFLYASPLLTLELVYRLEGRIVAVGVADLEPGAISAVYCYFDPRLERRSLGVFNVLRLIEEARRRGRRWAYLGFYVEGSRTMEYKQSFRPCEIRREDGGWERRGARAGGPSAPR